VLNKLDGLHYIIRGDSALSHRLVDGQILTKFQLRELLAAAPRNDSNSHALGSGIMRTGDAEGGGVTDREVQLLFEILNRNKEGLGKTDYMKELRES
jgi:hypothetical protein